jgi:hypothetical protein
MIGAMHGGDRRKQMRYDLISRIRCRTLSDPEEEIEGFTFNISISGICIDLARPVAAGQYISVTKCILPYFHGIFSVRWVQKVDTQSHNCYRAGLMFRDTNLLR